MRYYGLVKKHMGGPLHLLRGRAEQALCGARRPGDAWAVTMRGIVTAEQALSMDGVCHNCVKALPS